MQKARELLEGAAKSNGLSRALGIREGQIARPALSSGPSHSLTARLETEPRLELDHATSQCSTGLSKMRIVDGHIVGIARERNQIELVEEVKEIGAQVQLCIFTFEQAARRRLGDSFLSDSSCHHDCVWNSVGDFQPPLASGCDA